MTPVLQLWLPILCSTVIVFFASFLAWMVLPHHKKDVNVLPDENALLEQLKKLNKRSTQEYVALKWSTDLCALAWTARPGTERHHISMRGGRDEQRKLVVTGLRSGQRAIELHNVDLHPRQRGVRYLQ